MSNSYKKVLVISGFPCVGKSQCAEYNSGNYKCLDLDSSRYSRGRFPDNYLEEIKLQVTHNSHNVDVVLVSSHKIVRDGLLKMGIDFVLVYPSKDLRDEYLNRSKNRINPEVWRGSKQNPEENALGFRGIVGKFWYEWLDEIKEEKGYRKVELSSHTYLSHVLKRVVTSKKSIVI